MLNALYIGRHCLVNTAGVDGSGLETACTIANDEAAFKNAIAELYAMPFSEEDISKRKTLLAGLNNNKLNAEKIIHLFWKE